MSDEPELSDVVTGPAAPPLDVLIDRITLWPYGMPVRPMEQVLASGGAAVPALAEALARWQDDEERDLLCLVVLLGETRHPDAVPPLVVQLRRTDWSLVAQAATEALARIGGAAVPALVEVARTGDPLERLHAYAGLGWIADDRAYGALVDALARDPELGDVIAMALADQGTPEAIPALYEAYGRCEPWQRVELEYAMRALHRGWERGPLRTRDWRLRYRPDPALEGAFAPEWVAMAALLRTSRDTISARPSLALRPLAEILADPPEAKDLPETCEECGAPLERPTGIPACPESAVSGAVYQLRLLEAAREDGIEDLFELLDELEAEEAEHRDRGEPRTPRARERWQDEVSELMLSRETCQWLIEQGVEQVGRGKALVLARLPELAARYGDPQGLLGPVRGPQRRADKVGRNAPCPCGSGRKHKHCCLGKE